MCIIIDNNVRDLVFREEPADEYKPVADWIDTKGGKFVIGGKLTEELNEGRGYRALIGQYKRKGSVRSMETTDIDADIKEIARIGKIKSDDQHVLALARVSGARTLCTNEDDLTEDFKNKAIINNPRGNIYKNPSHKHLLKHTPSCGQGKKQH
jgi:hypothetical protein